MIQEKDILSKNNRKLLEKFVFNASKRYFKGDSFRHYYSNNYFPKSFKKFEDNWVKVFIPDKFLDSSLKNCNYILVDTNSIHENKNDFLNIDWVRVIFIFLSCYREYQHEKQNIKINSYSFKLKKTKKEIYDYAWVNRIFLILRKFFAIKKNKKESILFGKKPRAEIFLTHDVDVISPNILNKAKTLIFEIINIVRFYKLKRFLKNVYRLLFLNEDYFHCLKKMIGDEKKLNIKSTFFIYSHIETRNIKSFFINPSYKLNDLALKKIVNEILLNGNEIGLHPSYRKDFDKKFIMKEKKQIENIFNVKIIKSRQHWLNFSISKTWRSLMEAGIKMDFTLGFNDKYGFRNGSALSINPFDYSNLNIMDFKIMPLVLMDSHLFHYENINENSRFSIINELIEEVNNVGGTVSILWHHHTLTKNYNWNNEFNYLLNKLHKIKFK